MEVKNTFTSLIPDLPYPSKQSPSNNSVNTEEKSEKHFNAVLKDELNQEKQTTETDKDKSSSVNIHV